MVFPLAIGDERASELLSRAVMDHLQIHAMVAQLAIEVDESRVSGRTARRLAEAPSKRTSASKEGSFSRFSKHWSTNNFEGSLSGIGTESST